MNQPAKEPQSERRMGGGSTFSLATLMTIVALCAIGFAITYYTVGLGVAYFVIAGLAFVRLKIHYRTAWRKGWGATANSLGQLLFVLPLCCGVAFVTNCFAGGVGGEQLGLSAYYNTMPFMWLAFGLGTVTALQTAELVFALCLRKRA